jgi:hypothetical protein
MEAGVEGNCSCPSRSYYPGIFLAVKVKGKKKNVNVSP